MKHMKHQRPDTADMTRAEYNAVDALSYTGMKQLAESPAAYQKWLADTATPDPEKEDGRDLIIGRAVHALVLQPQLFKSLFAIVPEDAPKRPTLKQREAKKPSPASLEAIAFWDSFDADNADKTVLKRNMLDIAEGCAAGILRYLSIHDLAHVVDPATSWLETPILFKNVTTLCKAQLDVIDQDGWIWDLKTITGGLSDGNIRKAISSHRYHWQAYHYLTAAKSKRDDIKGIRYIFVEKEPDSIFDSVVFNMDGRWLEWGEKSVTEMCVLWENCRKTGVWHSKADSKPRSADLLLGDPKDKQPSNSISF